MIIKKVSNLHYKSSTPFGVRLKVYLGVPSSPYNYKGGGPARVNGLFGCLKKEGE